MRRILIISPCSGEGAGAEIVLEELLRAWTAEDLQLVLLTPAESRIHRVALECGFEWHDLPVKKNGLHMRDNLRAVKAVAEEILKCDIVFAWTIRVFPAAEWLSRMWAVPAAGTLHDNPFPRKIHGPVLWDMRGMNFQSLRDWREMIWCTQELVLRTWWRWQWAHRAANRFEQLVCVSDAVRQECVKKGYQCELSVIRNGLADIPVPKKVFCDKVRIGFLGMSRLESKGFGLVEQWIPQLQGDVVWNLYGNASGRTLKRIEHLLQPLSLEEVRGGQRNGGYLKKRGCLRQPPCDAGLDLGQKASCASSLADELAVPNRFRLFLCVPLRSFAVKTLLCLTRLFSEVTETNGCKKNVEYRGQQDPETIFREIDILVHPSMTFDSLPTALIEAARAGIPCVASLNGGAAEIVDEGASGFLFDAEDSEEGLEKLKRMLGPELRDQMGRNARRVFEAEFRVARMEIEYGQMFTGLLGGISP